MTTPIQASELPQNEIETLGEESFMDPTDVPQNKFKSWLPSFIHKKSEDDGVELLSHDNIRKFQQQREAFDENDEEEVEVAEPIRTSISSSHRQRKSNNRRIGASPLSPDKPSSTASLPTSSFFIIGSEFCERFTYYGMKTILALFFVHRLKMSERAATEAMALFAVASYATPLIGAYISDAILGRYKTIVRLSSVYLTGTILMAVAAAISSGVLVLTALSLVAFGTGGIKPNVSAFGGDQINPPEPVALQRFFSFFYAAINAGSLLSSLTTPVVRILYGYSMAFALPALLMFIALIALVWGEKSYRHVPPQGDLTTATLGVVSLGLKSWWRGGHSLANCLDGAIDAFGVDFVNDVRKLTRVFVLFLPAPLFWSLFDQQSSRWTFQATKMNSNVGGVFIPPEMVTLTLGVLLCEVLLCEITVCLSQVHRMAAGMVLASVSFGIAAIVQMNIESAASSNGSSSSSSYLNTTTSSFNDDVGDDDDGDDIKDSDKVSVMWLIPQYVVMTSGEILFSVTGLEFAFKEAPSSMKSVVTSGWLLTTAMGNLFTVVFLEVLTKNMNQVQEFIAFSFGCMMAMFWLLYLFHCYQQNSWSETNTEPLEEKESVSTSNKSHHYPGSVASTTSTSSSSLSSNRRSARRDLTPEVRSLPFPMSSASFHQVAKSSSNSKTSQGYDVAITLDDDDDNGPNILETIHNLDIVEDIVDGDSFHEPSFNYDNHFEDTIGDEEDDDDDQFADCDLSESCHGITRRAAPLVVDIL